MSMILIILESLLLASSCSLDAFAASFAYGSKSIKIPILSNLVVNIICGAILGVSLWVGTVVGRYLPSWLTTGAAFVILLIIGLAKLLDSVTKSIIRKYSKNGSGNLCREIKFSMFNINFILNLYANPENADTNCDRIISTGEAAALAVSLSLDGIAAGFGAALASTSIPAVLLSTLLTGITAVSLGSKLGNKLARTLPVNISWLSGMILICLALSKLF